MNCTCFFKNENFYWQFSCRKEHIPVIKKTFLSSLYACCLVCTFLMITFTSCHGFLTYIFIIRKNFVAESENKKMIFWFAHVVQKHLLSNKQIKSCFLWLLISKNSYLFYRHPYWRRSEIFRISEWGKERSSLKQVYFLI